MKKYKRGDHVSESKRCVYTGCGKGGAHSFNSLCNYHWNKIIEENIKKVVAANKKDPL